jgi:pyrroloquinoline-quinone synthase
VEKFSVNGTLSQQIDQVVEKKRMLNHPFYRLWTEGKLSLNAIQEYAKQYYSFVYQFPTFISAIHSNAATLEQRQLLLTNLVDEEQGEKNHPELWLRFCDGLGLTRPEVKSTKPLLETEDLKRTFKTLCQKDSFAEGLAALYAYESQIPQVSQEKIETLKRFYDLSDPSTVEFFSVHQEADIEHSRISRDILDSLDDDSVRQRAIRAAQTLSESLWKFLDGIYYNFAFEEAKART